MADRQPLIQDTSQGYGGTTGIIWQYITMVTVT